MADNIFGNLTPAITNGDDGTDYTLGTRFRRSTSGQIVRGRWYFPDPVPTGTVEWVLYDDATQAELARQAFVAPVAGSWNETPNLAVPVDYTANTLLRASIYTPNRYVATTSFFATTDHVNGDITAPGNAGGSLQNNGWLGSTDEFPSIISGNAASFFADIVFAAESTTVTGSVAVDLPTMSAAVTGNVESAGTLDITLPTLSGAVTGNVLVNGSLDVTLPTLSFAATGDVSFDGELTAALPTMSAAATGSVLVPIDGELDADLPVMESEFVGSTQVIDIFSQAFAVVTGVGMCVVDDLDRTEWGSPDRICLAVPGEIAWDDCQCGQFAQTITQDVPSENFPIAATDRRTTACGPQHLVVSVTASLVRCVTGINRRDGKPPTCDELLRDARRLEDDRTALRLGVTCCLRALRDAYTITEFTVGAATTVGPQGGCVGVELTYQFGLRNVCCGID